MKGKKFLVVHHFNSLNKGDASILKATVSIVKERFPGAEFMVLSLYPELDKKREKRIVFVNGIPVTRKGFLQKPITLVKMLWFILLAKLGLTELVSGRNGELLNAYKWADAIISQSADCFTDSYGSIMSIITLWQVEVAHAFRKPVYALGHTIGPFKGNMQGLMTQWLMKRSLNECKVVLAREKTSLSLLKEMGVQKPFVGLSADAAFALPSAGRVKARQLIKGTGVNNGGLKVGVIPSSIIHNYGFHKLSSREKKYAAYKEVVKENIRFLSEKMNASVILMGHSFGPLNGANDQKVAGELFMELKKEGNKKVFILNEERSPEEIKAVIGEMDAVISARTHAVIHAIAGCVPALVIEYIHKGQGILSMVGQGRWKCDIRNLNSRELNSKSMALLEEKNAIKKEMQEKIGSVLELSQKNAEVLYNSLTGEKK